MEEGWHDDPTGRFKRRYHNGTRWTEHVEVDGEVQSDREGRAALNRGDDNAGSGQGFQGFLDGLGPEPRERPHVRLSAVLAGFGGAFVAGGVLALASDSLDSGGPLIVLGAVLVAAGFAARESTQLARHDVLRHAGTGCGIVGVFATGTGIGIAVGGDSGLRLAEFATAAMFFGLWAARGYRERPTFFGLGVAALVTFVASLFLGSDSSFEDDYYGTYNDGWFDEYLGDLGNFVTRTGAVYLAIGVVLLVLVYLADKRGLVGLGTAFAFNAILSSGFGAVLLLSKFEDVGGSILIAGVGAAMAVAGSLGGRRASTWIGGTLVAIGVLTGAALTIEPTSTGTTALVGFLGGAILIGAAPAVRWVRANRETGTGDNGGGIEPPATPAS